MTASTSDTGLCRIMDSVRLTNQDPGEFWSRDNTLSRSWLSSHQLPFLFFTLKTHVRSSC